MLLFRTLRDARELRYVQRRSHETLDSAILPHLLLIESNSCGLVGFLVLSGSYLHLLHIFPDIRGHGWGKASVDLLITLVDSPISLLATPSSYGFWHRQSFTTKKVLNSHCRGCVEMRNKW